MWTFLTKRHIEPNTPVKFGLAFVFIGLGYFIFYFGGMVGKSTG
jgi:POT family proton-dependent oligopeptide transporter